GLGRTFMLWLAANMVVTTMLTGTLFVPGISYATALLVIVVRTLIGVTVLVLVGTIGTRTGLPTMLLTRGSFGRRGGHLPALFNLIVLMGWSWVQALLAGITLNYVVAGFTGFSSPVLFAVLCQTIVVVLARLGRSGIQRVEPWLGRRDADRGSLRVLHGVPRVRPVGVHAHSGATGSGHDRTGRPRCRRCHGDLVDRFVRRLQPARDFTARWHRRDDIGLHSVDCHLDGA